MRTTLFYIPSRLNSDILGLPVFGMGWLLIAWTLFSIVTVIYLYRQHGWKKETIGVLPILVIVALVIVFLLPMLEIKVADKLIGLPIRGYGMMVLLGIVSGVGLAAYRAKRMGLHPETMYSLAFWLFVGRGLFARDSSTSFSIGRQSRSRRLERRSRRCSS